MGQIRVKADSVLDAPSADVYATIADYRQGHPQIVPKENFYDMLVEQGGYGAGTTIRFKMKVLGVERTLHHRVSEPEPGRVLVEQDIDAPQNIVTTFTVTPLDNGERSHVEISTTLNTSPGLAGIVERIVVPLINSRIYRKEMKKLEAVARERTSAHA
ncbi:MAG TPA: SRPBCC family protein [Ktedonobacteraceae bacterium]|nr:SRPBCC family protein [Ktedonobacteraceae bacterium]HEV2660972.1 SRPBCC family protein [Ktedonobacteraceae bacterium]